MRRERILGLLFGIAFGFLLQKGGVAKLEVLIGVLLLQDFTVVAVMLSAIAVGTIGVHVMDRLGLVRIEPKPTRYLANVVGGLVFGVGFALSAYCPGTGAAALGQGNLDALFVLAGMVVGSYAYALASARLASSLERAGDRGTLTWPGLLGLSPVGFAVGLALVLLVAVALIPTGR